MPDVKQLGLEWRTRRGGYGKTERKYLTFTIDGISFYDGRIMRDMVSGIGWLPVHSERRFIECLLLQRDNEYGNHYLLYICPECGDIECGAFATTITKTADHFVWSDFCFLNNYDDSVFKLYSELEPIYFDKTQYWETFQRRLSELDNKIE